MRIPDEEGHLGKYDQYCRFVQHATDASIVILMVVNGKHGSGMSITSVDQEASLKLPAFLRMLADDIEAQNKKVKGN